MIKIEWKNKATKQFLKLPQEQQIQIADGVDVLYNFPNVQNVKTLKNHKYQYRLRIGRFRILFNFRKVIEIISIEEVKKRDDNTY
ncbi:type II toxin-antitoxin system RelE/ParE family toxin [Treponema sp. OMZ 788]|uniref:type II toxin-antitoxin system RelE family toxin n=1 Tax=Treponema sp. OMZ 788 TaxID=2563664 RepID=UPI0020A287F1|nr:type II toxin-antitoxin system RelE/ParE family toxin [Treponema sp. OMZ 788]UTC65193.1 type II toxin-antitoxin system RelE/ParE family toxin [Treponema sp. OMZ 788]